MFSYKRQPIRNQFRILVFTIIITVLIIFFAAYSSIVDIIRKNNYSYNNEMIIQIKQQITSKCILINKIMTNFAYYNKNVEEIIITNDTLQQFELQSEIKASFLRMEDLSDSISNIIIYSNAGNSYFLNGRNDELLQKLKALPENASNYYTGVTQLTNNNRVRPYIISATNIYSSNNEILGDKIGTLAILIDTATFFNVVRPGISDRIMADYFILDRNGGILWSSNPQAEASELETVDGIYPEKTPSRTIDINGQSYIVNVSDLPEISGRIISLLPEEKLLSGIEGVQLKSTGGLIIFMIMISLLISLTIKNILKPISVFVRFMSEIKSGNLRSMKKRIQVDGSSDIITMAHEFNSMLDEINNLTHSLVETNTRLYEAELEKKQAELDFLQSQINPHFLYNTFDSIKGIAYVKGIYEVHDMADALSHIFQYSLKSGNEVLLSEELSIAEKYFKIQQVRFSNRIEVRFHFKPDLMQCAVLKMILQPIIENSVFHGLEPCLGKGILELSGEIDGEGRLVISVKDNGTGISPDTLEELKKALCKTNSSVLPMKNGKSKIGILNVNNRIKLSYGENYGIAINSVEHKGTEIKIILPVRRAADNVQCIDC